MHITEEEIVRIVRTRQNILRKLITKSTGVGRSSRTTIADLQEAVGMTDLFMDAVLEPMLRHTGAEIEFDGSELIMRRADGPIKDKKKRR